MKKIYLNDFNNIALVIDDGRKVYALTKAQTARKITNNKKTGFYRAKIERIAEVLRYIKADGYKRAKTR